LAVEMHRRESRVLWLLTIGLALAGQYALMPPHDDNLGLGLGLFALAGLGLLGLMGHMEALEPPEPPLSRLAAPRSHPVVWLTAGLALLEAILALLLLRDRQWNTPCWDVFALWLASIVLALLAGLAATPQTRWPAWRKAPDWLRPAAITGLRAHWIEVLLVTGIVLVGLAVRVVALDTIPTTLGGDEGSQGMEALRFLDGRLQNMFVTGWLGVPTMSFLLQAMTLRLFGADMAGLRVLWALVGTATLPALYALTRQLFDRRTALIATAFLAAYHYHIHYSRLGSNQIADGLFLTAALATLVWGLRGSTVAFALSGLIAGLGMYFYAGARLVPIVLVAVLLLMVATARRGWRVPPSPGSRPRPDWVTGWEHLALLALGFAVAAAPMLLFAQQHPGDFNARINQVGIIQSGWLAREPGLTGKSLETILAEQFLESTLAFNHYWDRTVWYGLQQPLLSLAPGALAVLGFMYALVHWRERRYAIPVLWVGSVIVFGAFLTENPPSSQRLTGAAPALAILVAVGLVRMADLARAWWNLALRRSGIWHAALALVVCLLAVMSLHLYFVEYTPTHVYGNVNAQAATALGHYLRNHPGNRVVYFFAPPRMYFGFGSIGYLAPTAVGVDVHDPLTGPPTFVNPDLDALFVFLPERLEERRWVESSYPNGTWQTLPDHRGLMMLALYEVQCPAEHKRALDEVPQK